jgi:hypothetical protein
VYVDESFASAGERGAGVFFAPGVSAPSSRVAFSLARHAAGISAAAAASASRVFSAAFFFSAALGSIHAALRSTALRAAFAASARAADAARRRATVASNPEGRRGSGPEAGAVPNDPPPEAPREAGARVFVPGDADDARVLSRVPGFFF